VPIVTKQSKTKSSTQLYNVGWTMTKLAKLQASRAMRRSAQDKQDEPAERADDMSEHKFSMRRRYLNYNGAPMLANELGLPREREDQPDDAQSQQIDIQDEQDDQAPGSRADGHSAGSYQQSEVQSRRPSQKSYQPSNHTEPRRAPTEEQLYRATEAYHLPHNNTYHRYKRNPPQLAKTNSDQKTKESSGSDSKTPSLVNESGTKRQLEKLQQDQYEKSGIKQNITAYKDLTKAYHKSLKQMEGYNKDRLLMVSRNMQPHRMNSENLE